MGSGVASLTSSDLICKCIDRIKDRQKNNFDKVIIASSFMRRPHDLDHHPGDDEQ